MSYPKPTTVTAAGATAVGGGTAGTAVGVGAVAGGVLASTMAAGAGRITTDTAITRGIIMAAITVVRIITGIVAGATEPTGVATGDGAIVAAGVTAVTGAANASAHTLDQFR